MSRFLPVLLLTLNAAASPTLSPPPATPAEPVTETLHGVAVTDPFRWLEGPAAPERKGLDNKALETRVATWTAAHNARSRAFLDALPGRAALEKRLTALFSPGSESAPRHRGNRVFFSRREGTQSNSVIFVREADGSERAVLDVNKLYPDGLTTLSFSSSSPDGKLLAFGTFRAGDENTALHILDLESGRWRDDTIGGKVGRPDWLPDSSGFLYRNLSDVKNPYSGKVCFHVVGRPVSEDAILFEQLKEGPLATTWGPGGSLSEDGHWLILSYSVSTTSNDLWLCDFDLWRKTGKLVKVPLALGLNGSTSGTVHQGKLYLHSNVDAPNGRLFLADPKNPARATWREIVPHRADAVLSEWDLTKSHLLVTWQKDALDKVSLYSLEGQPQAELELPGIGSAGVSSDPEREEIYLSFTSYNEPSSLYRYDLPATKPTLYFRPKVDFDPATVEVKQVFYTSKDGTKVPMFLIHRKGLTPNKMRPTVLYGYGGFSISMTPGFNSSLLPWLEAGGVYAVANLRGGAEYGDAWHRAGMLGSKQNVFDDFIAAAERLVADGWTDSEHLAIQGGSNGGLLVSAVGGQRPDLFRAVVCQVPLTDMFRYQNFLMARYWVPEYGSSENAEQFAWLRKWSPYHNLRPDARHPAWLIEGGENDARTHPLHARKLAARLFALGEGNPKARDILLVVDQDSGHGSGKSFAMRVRDSADRWLWLANELGAKLPE